ncbi:DNA-directed RNA polymerase alpha subunit [Lactobacillus colini]|uniref:DNA-directed RNA polymerase alpha subunit n=1 Tax=Lactobacillus colini TaxID=1819254 RepID=A0ABS4MD35_9LACO|nr:hypothetical protein [Lactobacillus colini]MBP2057595.1 DNA-directed RNA polymerase alpha subunit [Lactobacillus colini]
MKLDSFLQLTQDLNPKYFLYYRPQKKDKIYPIAKVTLSTQECLFETKNTYPKSLANIQKILRQVHQTDTSLFINHQNIRNEIYGVQIDLQQGKIYLF